jgi:GTP cyclohydrolase I
LERTAPVSGSTGLLDYACTLVGDQSAKSEEYALAVEAPVASVCPCSKAISDYGAHNQRGYVRIEARLHMLSDGPAMVWFEELIEIAEDCGSSAVFPVLKRSDERHVTMHAYDRPAFVEDMARGAAEQLMRDARVDAFVVHVKNQESIHNHAAFARVTGARTGMRWPGIEGG